MSTFNTLGRRSAVQGARAFDGSRMAVTLRHSPRIVQSRGLATPVGSGSREASHRVVVVGGGTAGQAASHQLLRTGLFSGKADILLIDPSSTHDYQPGWTLVGAGLKTREELRKPMAEVVGTDDRLHFVQDAVSTFEPEQNKLKTRDGRTISYENLIVCPGIGIKWDGIKGLEERLQEGKNVTSIYRYETCAGTYPMINSMREGKAIFTQPAGVIKCAGAPQKIMWLALDQWRKEGLYNVEDPSNGKIQITFASGMPTIFSAPKWNAALDALRQERNVEGLFLHNLTEINGNVATFNVLGADGKSTSTLQRDFDFLHVTPAMGPLPFIKNSPLADAASGFVEVDQSTTQHKRYPNVWSIGDSSSLPTSKTAAAITAQTPVLVANLVAKLQGKSLEETYDGYTSCPLLTEYGKVMLAEFKYGGAPKETFAMLGIDQAKPQRAFYPLKKDFFPWVYYQSLVKGTWAGPSGWQMGNAFSSAPQRGINTFARQQRRSFATSSSSMRNTPARRPRDPLDSAPNAVRHALASGETLIVRPPSTKLSPLYATSEPVGALPTTQQMELPPLSSRRRTKKNDDRILSETEIAKVQLLRKQNPTLYTANRLARQFKCSPLFIQIVAPAPKEKRQTDEAKGEAARAGWGTNKTLQRALRSERRSLW